MPGTFVGWTNTLKLCGSSEACGQSYRNPTVPGVGHCSCETAVIALSREDAALLCTQEVPCPLLRQLSGPLSACTHSFSAPWPESQVIMGPLRVKSRGLLAPPLRVLGCGGPGPPCSGSGGTPAEPCRPPGAERTPLSAFSLCHPASFRVRDSRTGAHTCMPGSRVPGQALGTGKDTCFALCTVTPHLQRGPAPL